MRPRAPPSGNLRLRVASKRATGGRMRSTLILAALTFLTAPALRADSAADAPPARGYADTLLALDQQFWEAAAKGDTETIGRLFADDYIGIAQDQSRWTRSALLEQ